MNYKVTRIGLLNFWYFDDEEFNFFDGKLLLRGGNGSGKSVTMQSFIPLILDGNKTPSRLDPFGTKEKKIEDYLLGPQDGEQKDDAIGYLYMETYDKEKDKYITIGMGLHARKAKPTEFWGFALKDGKRIGRDFQLYKNYNAKVLMTKKELKAALGIENIFVETAKEYKTLVNDLLFGFRDLDSYDEYINVLLQLRSSKLSKEYNPTKLMTILSSVLQPLTDDDIRPLSDAIEDNNKTKEKIDTLNSNIKALTNLSKVYQNYNEIYLYNKALKVSENETLVNKKAKQITIYETETLNIKEKLTEIEIKINKNDNELTEIITKLSTIDNEDLKKYTEELNSIENSIITYEETINIIKQKLEERLEREKTISKIIKNFDDKIYLKDNEIKDIKDTILSLTDEVNLTDINLNIKEKDINFEYLEDRIIKFKNKVNQIKIKLEEKEELEKSLSKLEEEQEKTKKELDQKEMDKNNYQKELYEAIDNFKDDLILLDKTSKVVKLDQERKQKIFSLINDYNSNNYLLAKEEYLEAINRYELDIIKEKSNAENKLSNEQKKLQELNYELNLLKETEELEYIDESLKDAEIELNTKNIPYIQLYKAIEFKEGLNNQDKDKLEELLISMNILNAKIVPSNYLNKVKNIKSIFLKAGAKKKNNLLSYFNVLDNLQVSKKEIEDILSSISINKDDNIYITPDNYEFDFLIGYPSDKYQSKYIGIIKRKEEHKKNIILKEEEISQKEKIINNYKNIINELIEKLEDIENTRKKFPSNDALEKINTTILSLVILINRIYEKNKEMLEEANRVNNLIKSKIEEINDIKDNVKIPLNLLSYKNTLLLIEDLIKNLNNLKNNIEILNNYNEQKLSSIESLEMEKDAINSQNEELSEKTKTLNELKSKKKVIEEILANPDFKKKIDEVKKLTERKNEIPIENNQLREEKGKLTNSLENICTNLEIERTNLTNEQLKLELNKEILEKEYNLHYVYQNEELNVKKIINDLKNRENSDINKALENYIMAYNNYKQELLDYRLTTKEIFNNDTIAQEYIEKGLDEKTVNQLLTGMNRQDLETIYQGKKLNIYELNECLKEAIEESQNYINNQERYLFEDILLKTVGNKIRDRIESSKEWVKRINEIMKATQIDSNLSFELEWKNKQAFTEEELDTKEIVRLFKIDAGQLERKDSDKLINHFRSQIKKELEFNDKINDSYANIIFKVLDYRNWFEFKLFYKRKASEKKELTNKVFSVLSGGERAKSMYVPLFASVYAKLLSADKKALRLIALDEAFAGVDNDNIREMFNILSQLNLDYILTSQALWGDYDTVSDLSICELIKDEIHKAVAVRHYRWNGYSKEILEKSDLYE